MITELTPGSTVSAETKAEQRERVLRAAVTWVYDGCTNSLAELEDAVEDLIGVPVGRDED